MVNAKALAAEVVRAVRNVYGSGPVQLHRPFIAAEDAEMVRHAAATQPVGYGYLEEFEQELSLQTGSPYVVAVSSGTAALHLSMLALGVGAGSTVCVPPLTFAGAAAAVVYTGATPVFSDDAPSTCAAQIKLHLLGRPNPDVTNARYPVPMIEDAAAALGSRGEFGRICGATNLMGVLSFNNNKIVTTGGGGAVLTQSAELAQKVRHLATTAKKPSPFYFEHDAVGFNYRMPNIAAAMGLGQLLRLPAILRAKRKIHEAYQEAFAGIEEVQLDQAEPGTYPNHWLNSIKVPAGEAHVQIMESMFEEEIACRALFAPLPTLPPYRSYPADTPALNAALRAYETTICIPSGAMP